MKLILFSLLLTVASTAYAAKDPGFQLHKFDTQKLPNGMTILWLEDQTLPYLSLEMMLKAGSSQDPVGKEGLAGFTASMLEKGTTKRSATQISEDLEQIGSGFDDEVEPDYTLLSASSLSFTRDNLLKQFSEIVLNPSFTTAEIERQRKHSLGNLQKLADSPENFSEYLMTGFLFGSTHPYGHESMGKPKSVKSFKRVDMQKFYAANFAPDNAVLVVVGKYDEAFKQSVVKSFEGWKSKSAELKVVPEFPVWKGKEILLVDRSDLNQAQIQIGFKGIPRNIPEYLAVRAALKILGESFGSRLFDEIRVKRGLTYHIHATFDPRAKSGPMSIYTFTRADKIGETVQETLSTYKKFVQAGVTDAEVGVVKALMRGQFPRTFETPEGLARQLLMLNLYGVSTDYLTHYLANLDAMTKDDVNQAIKKYFDADNLRILVYAPKEAAQDSLKKLGNVEVKNYKMMLQ